MLNTSKINIIILYLSLVFFVNYIINSDCPPPVKYNLNGLCYETCPEYSVPNKIEEYCFYCPDDTNFFNNKCVKDCKEPFIISIKNEADENITICEECKEGEWYTSGSCKTECDFNCYKLKEDRSCHLCFCNNKGKCENDLSNICKCDDPEHYFGKSCEFYRKNINEELKIIPLFNTAIKSNVSLYKFYLNKTDFTNYKIKWEFFLGTKEITSDSEYKKYFITGNKEEIFGINPYLLSEEKNNYLRLNLTSLDNNNYLIDEIQIYIQKINYVGEHKVHFLSPTLQDQGYTYKSMNTKIEIEQIQYINLNKLKYYFQFSFLDENNEEIPLTNFDNSRSLETYHIPFAKQYFINIKNDRGEINQYEVESEKSDIYLNYNISDLISKSIEDIKNDGNYNDIEKIFCFIILFNSKEKIISREDLYILFNFINNLYSNFINENGYYKTNQKKIINYSEPKILFSLINSIIISQRKFLDYTNFQIILDSLKQCIDILNKNIKLSSKDIISMLRTIEQLHDAYNENLNITQIQKNMLLSDFYYLFDKINNYLSLKLLPGEGIKIIGNRTVLFSYNLGFYQQSLAISSNNLTSPANISNINTYSYENYGLNEEICGNNGETFLSINEKLYKNIQNNLKNQGYDDIKNISLNIYIVNNIKNNRNNTINEIYNENENDNYLVRFQFYDLNEKSIINNMKTDKNLFYFLEFSYKNEKQKLSFIQKIGDKDSIFYMPYNYSNVFCYPKNYIKNTTYYCFTYFDYITNIIQCKCNIIDEIAIIEDKELSNFYKSLQFNTVKYTYFSDLTKIFIIIFTFLLLIPGLIFLLFDINKINKHINNLKIDFKEKRREYYNQVKIYENSRLTFPIYSTFNKFPYCEAFYSNNYTNPKYIRHLVVITALLLGFILNLIPFYFTLPFEEKQLLIDKRDIRVDEDEIHSIRIINKYLVRGFIYALVSLIFVHLFIKLFNRFLKIEEKNIKYWKNIKDIFKDYVYFNIKKKRYFGKNFERIKYRMKAFYAICGRYLLNKNIINNPERNKKLENYLKYSGKINKLIKGDKVEIKNNYFGTKSGSLLYELPDNNIEDNNIINSEYQPPKFNINLNISNNINSTVLSSFEKEKNIKLVDFLKKLNPVKSDNFQINGLNDNIFGINNNSINRLEKIKNKYINTNKFISNNYLKRQKNQNTKYIFSIYYNNNLSFINKDNYIISIKNDITGENSKEFRLLVFFTLILGFIFFLLIISSILLIKKLMNEYEYFMVKIWLLCTILILIVAYFLIYFIKISIGSILLFNFFARRKKGYVAKYMFKIFVDKSLIYMFKIRNYITKYRREFINI